MSKLHPRVKQLVAVLVLVITGGLFAYYFTTHPEARQQLLSVNPWLLIALIGLYGLFMISLVLIQTGTLALCDTKLKPQENFLLTIYSSIVNFFGPLQSGPGFRAIYLKKRHGTKLKNYTLATLMYYGFFALFSGIFLISGLVGWRLIGGLMVLGSVLTLIFIFHKNRWSQRIRTMNLSGLYLLAAATLLQVFLVAIIYFLELRSIDSGINFGQALTYTGAANFALFVSLTPGAIGFRESFLLFSQDLHHISSPTILGASLIDRGIYVVVLGLLFLLVLSLHAKDRLSLKHHSR
jgi:uncharacterized membrane protein YbhN (UPF0104 family)